MLALDPEHALWFFLHFLLAFKFRELCYRGEIIEILW